MKTFAFAVILAAVLAGGCSSEDSPVERVRQQVTGDYPTQTRNFPAGEPATYVATQAALKRMGYRVTGGGKAQRFVDAISRIDSGDRPGTLQQIKIHAEFSPSLDGKSTDVTVRMSETIADDNAGRFSHAAETPLRDTPLYNVFFRSIQEGL